MNREYNAEYINTSGGQLEEIKKYCLAHSCSGKDRFGFEEREQCRSYRNGKCMMVEFIKDEVIKEKQ